ncbi:MAG: hypothetical protein H6975_07150 [Gammaproteobacteria bacterium]|nr:hypothetical protein [Gammaproteobacteria bacterium]
MARQFGNLTIRADGLDGKKAFQFEAQLLGMLRGLEATETGRVLFSAFRAVGREVLLFPYNDSLGHCNAYATTDWGLYRNKVSFTPKTWFTTSACYKTGAAGNSAHEVLFHELVHAIRFAAKTMGKHMNDGQEEEIAILVTNIYSSETHRPLRQRHADFSELKNTTSVTFHAKHRALIDLFCKEHPALSLALARVSYSPFNPLREYYDRER